MNRSDYRLLLAEIRDQIQGSKSTESTFCRLEDFQRYLVKQDPTELPVSLQLRITASPYFNIDHPYCEEGDFDAFGGWESFFVQSKVMELFTLHDCQTCTPSSIQGCLICLTLVAFSGHNLEVENQAVQMRSSRFNGFQSAVEGSASTNEVSLKFISTTQEPIGCSVKT